MSLDILRPRPRTGLGYSVSRKTREILYLSASAISKADVQSDGCVRKWWFRYCDNRPEPHKEAQAEGVKMHAQIAYYLRTGIREMDALALSGMHLLPTPGPDLLVEHPISGTPALSSPSVFADGIPLIGELDLAHARGVNKGGTDIEDTEELPGTVEVDDHKSTRSFDWNMTREEMREDIQMLAYGEHLVNVLRNVRHVRLAQHYFLTSKRAPARKVSVVLTAEEVKDMWVSRVVPVVRLMRTAAKETAQDNVPANKSSCDTYGGCPHREYCTAGKRDALGALFASI